MLLICCFFYYFYNFSAQVKENFPIGFIHHYLILSYLFLKASPGYF